MEKLVEIKNITKQFPKSKDFLGRPNGFVYALNGVDLDIYKGEILGLVGESGCGKSTLGRIILRLIEPTSGTILFNGKNILNLNDKELKNIRKDMQIVFQNPQSSLNPRMKIRDLLAEPLILNTKLSSKEIDKQTDEMLECVGLKPETKNNYPHEFSGGQKQRIVIAKALMLKPEFIVADEPISALDISIQAQIIQLLKDLKTRFNLTYLFISHDLRTVADFCDRVAVMYLGEIVEEAPSRELFSNPMHPYSKMLLNAIPKIDFNSHENGIIYDNQEPVSNEMLQLCCNFAQRCSFCLPQCRTQKPANIRINSNHPVKCFLNHSDNF